MLEGLKRIFDIQNPNRKGEEAKERLDEFIERWEKIYPGGVDTLKGNAC